MKDSVLMCLMVFVCVVFCICIGAALMSNDDDDQRPGGTGED